MKELRGKVAVITGAASGIGRAIAERRVGVAAGGAAWEVTAQPWGRRAPEAGRSQG